MNIPSHIKLVIFGVDRSLVETKSGATFRKTADDWQWLPGRLDALMELHSRGIILGIATNQGGVAFGYLEEGLIAHELHRMQVEAPIGWVAVCYTHPNASIPEYYHANDPRRKPNPGMILEIQERAKVGPIHTLFVGDRPEDEQAAHNAGVSFEWSDEFFS
jgi:D-glycero-D-manno-heptose 1,7-bisphosphate phosphatase